MRFYGLCIVLWLLTAGVVVSQPRERRWGFESEAAQKAVSDFRDSVAAQNDAYEKLYRHYRDEFQNRIGALRKLHRQHVTESKEALLSVLRTAYLEASAAGSERQVEANRLRAALSHYERLVPTVPDMEQHNRNRSAQRIQETDWIDLLSYVQVDRHTVTGSWVRQADGVAAVQRGAGARLIVPSYLDQNYELLVEFTRTAGTNTVAVHLPVGSADCWLNLSGWNGTVCGLHRVDGKLANQFPENFHRAAGIHLQNGQRYRLHVRVTVDGESAQIVSALDDVSMLDWSGKASSLSSSVPLVNHNALYLNAWNSSVTFHRVAVHSPGLNIVPTRDVSP